MKPIQLIITLLFIFISCSALSASKSLYKWKDKNGVTQFGERPPAGVEYEVIKMRGGKGGSGAAAAPSITSKTSSKEDSDPKMKEQIDKANNYMKESCKIAKLNLDTLNNSARISIDDGEGGSRVLSDEERKQKLEQTQKQIKRFCNSDGKDK